MRQSHLHFALALGACTALVSCGLLAGLGAPPSVQPLDGSGDAGLGRDAGLDAADAGPDAADAGLNAADASFVAADAALDSSAPSEAGGQCVRTSAWGISGLNGKTYFVSASSGNDANPGTEAAPWLTIQQAGAVVGPGDTVIVMAGTYASPVFGDDTRPCPAGDTACVINGTSAHPILFEADPCAPTGSVVLGETAYSKSTANFGFYLEEGCDYVDVAGFTVTNAATSSNIWHGAIFVASNGNQILGNLVHDVTGYGIFVWGGSDVVVSGNTVTGVAGAVVEGVSSIGHGITVEGNSRGVQVVNNTINGIEGFGLFIDGDVTDFLLPGAVVGMSISGNVIFDNLESGIAGDGLQSSTIVNNVIYENESEGITLYEWDAYGGSTSNVIVNNTVDETMYSNTYAILITACAYDGTPEGGADDGGTLPVPPGCATTTADTSTGNIAFNNILLGSSGAASTVSANDLSLGLNITTPTPGIFVDSANGDYNLVPHSGVIGTGLVSFDGQVAPLPSTGLPDIGAFDFAR